MSTPTPFDAAQGTPFILTRDGLAAALRPCGLTQVDARHLVDAVLATLQSTLVAGGEVRLHDFGSLQARPTPARSGTGTFGPWQREAGYQIVFRPSQALKDAVNTP